MSTVFIALINNIFNMSDKSPISKLMQSINKFVCSKDDSNSILHQARMTSPEVANVLDKQMKTFEADIQKLENGTLSYAQMRAMYG